MYFTPITVLSILLFAGCSTPPKTDPAKKTHTHQSEQARVKKPSEYFPHRDDLPKLEIGTSLKGPEILERAEVNIPKSVASGRYQLRVLFIIEADGSVRDAVITQSSGVEALDRAYLETVKKERYAPAEYLGKPVPIFSERPIELTRIAR